MDLGTKNANNLINKDFNVQKSAAAVIINESDVFSFKILAEKSEFIFDFIKDKVRLNLLNAVNEGNVLNLFGFMKYYSSDFEDVIVKSFIKFNNDDIKTRMLNILKDGTVEEKTYAVKYFAQIKDSIDKKVIGEFIKSDFYPLKSASIELLSKYGDREEFDKRINILKTNTDEFEKFEAAEFLCLFGDKDAYEIVYDYFINSPMKDIFTDNILLLKNFEELLSNNDEDKIFKIYSVILKNFPESVNFKELSYCLNEGVFDFLLESDGNYPVILNYTLLDKLNLILSDEAYKIDLDKNDIRCAAGYKNALETFLGAYGKKEIIIEALKKGARDEILFALNLIYSDKEIENAVVDLINTASDEEIILNALYALKNLNLSNIEIINSAAAKVKNETVRAEILSLRN